MKKAIFSLKLRKDRKNIDGSQTICIYFRERGHTPRFLTTNFKCQQDDWSQKEQEYRQSVKNNYNLNRLLNALKKTCNTIIDNYYLANKPLSLAQFKKELAFNDQPCNNVFDYIQTVIHRKKGTIKTSSLKNYDQLYNKLALMYPKKDLLFSNVDYNFILRLDKYLHEHNNNKNTTCRKHKTFQVVINHALKDGLLKSNPYQFFNKGTIKGERKPLTEIEYKKLSDIYKSGDLTTPEKNALRMFLFMCMTSLRISDLLNLKYCNIVTDTDRSGNPVQLIDISQIKTGHNNSIPLFPSALELIKTSQDQPEPGEYIFKEYRNCQNVNYRLKDIAKKTGITKNLTNHVGRHTFATIALNNGMDIYTVSKILGHTDIKTTQIYTKLTTMHGIEEMQKISSCF